MSINQLTTKNDHAVAPTFKQQALQSAPVVLSIVMISSGVFVVLLAYGISILSKIN